VLAKSLAFVLFVVSSYAVAAGQPPAGGKETAKPATAAPVERVRDLAMPGGISLEFIIRELAQDMGVNVLFDPESFRPRRTSVELKNVSGADALKYILVQERLVAEEIGPKTILIAGQHRGTSIPGMGVGLTALTGQLAEYFGVKGGTLVNDVKPDSAGGKAGLKAGDVIVGVDGETVSGALGLIEALMNKSGGVALQIVRNRKAQTVNVAAAAPGTE
jgi:membrane-associated protease RseP (regulator of RpoE activity)